MKDPFLEWWTSIDPSNYSHTRDIANEAWDAAIEYITGSEVVDASKEEEAQ